MNHFFTSDTHYSHKNICMATSEWDDAKTSGRTRDFKTIKAMNKTIVDNINKTVGVDDVLYHMGDWSLGGKEQIEVFRYAINCKNVHLILGNHDNNIRKSKWLQDSFTSVSEVKQIKIDDQRIILCHYAMRVWYKSHKGSWMLHGHSHGSLSEDDHKSIDVGIDAAFMRVGKYKPYSFEEIQEIMSKKEINIVDHHIKEHTK